MRYQQPVWKKNLSSLSGENKREIQVFRDHWEASWLHQGDLDLGAGTSAYVGGHLGSLSAGSSR